MEGCNMLQYMQLLDMMRTAASVADCFGRSEKRLETYAKLTLQESGQAQASFYSSNVSMQVAMR